MGINVDGNGIGPLDPGSGGGGGGDDAHLTVRARLSASPQSRSEIQAWEGSEEKITDMFRSLKVGQYDGDVAAMARFLPEGGSVTQGLDYGYTYISNMSAPRRNGKTWTMDVALTQLKHVALWTMDFAEIAKPIQTWRQDFPPDDENRPSLPMLRKWERARDIQDWDDFDTYRTIDGEALTGATLTLAKMIREQGVEMYTVHAPVATLMMRYIDVWPGVGKLLDKQFSDLPGLPSGWVEIGAGRDNMEAACSFPDGAGGEVSGSWLCTGDRENPNADGSKTRTVQFTGALAINENIYPIGVPTDGGFV